eukprot:scaffold894_cov153-Cylindrotheca_fusiformis.AAC.1
MFQIGRFDPRAEANGNAKKKIRKRVERSEKSKDARKKQRNTEGSKEKPPSSLRVIAPETKGSISQGRKLNERVSEEAFDDLDLEENVLFHEG